ncbi:Conserved protein [Halorubrum sp. DM2]|uniref:helicase HerA domain-containing protein n=1 Tax=Halorubrum sp. DM2 TaxID=2527867 RepID=UPI0024B753E0|nr:DUF87 domain-containing protein [Halorubrum sp. DM2]VTT86096.1 Conserved protein [Halorubrum sp. DM2]
MNSGDGVDLPPQTEMSIDKLLEDADHVGGVFSTGYETCDILTNDKWTQDAGGLPKHTLLIARPLLEGEEIVSEEDVHNTNRLPEEPTEFSKPEPSETESTHALLLRVTEPADIPEQGRLRTNRFDAMREAITGDESGTPSPEDFVDVLTRREMQYSGVQTKILGTFHQQENDDGEEALTFTSDVQTFFSAGHYVVYKPDGDALQWIASYPTTVNNNPVKLGNVRYTTTDIWGDQGDVGMYFDVDEFIGAKTAVFGMTRKGKSNTMKIIAGAIEETDSDIGQLIFDPSGEYAYVNDQDEAALGELHDETGSISSVYKFAADADEKFRPLRTNLLTTSNLNIVRDYVNQELVDDSAQYADNFAMADIPTDEEIDDMEGGRKKRAKRRQTAFFAVISKAIGDLPESFREYISIDSNVQTAVNQKLDYDIPTKFGSIELKKDGRNNTLVDFWETVARNKEEINSVADDGDWIGEELQKILKMLQTSGSRTGYNKLNGLADYHSSARDVNVPTEIYEELENGEMVIVDISNGLDQVVTSETERIVSRVLKESMNRFRDIDRDEELPKIQVYLEEAHQHFEEYRDDDDMNPFVTLAKEGAKFDIGMTYATQEVSSVDSRVRANTANWIVTHINSKKETRELGRYYNFEDFAESIRNVEDVGYARAKTYRGEYIIPISVSLFNADWVSNNTEFGVWKDDEYIVDPPTQED